MNQDVMKFISGEAIDANANEIAKVAQQHGMVTMLQKGVLRALAGDTTLEEVNRVL